MLAPRSFQILLLEDEALIALDIESSLREEGLSVTSLNSCAAALEWLQTATPDLAILDIGLTDGPCHDVAEVLVEQNVPFIVHSGDSKSEYEDTPFSKGIWLNKPSRPEVLIDLVRTFATSASRATTIV